MFFERIVLMKKINYRRTLITLLVLIVSVCGVIGGTFAWFTDSSESVENVVGSGKLDMKVEVRKRINPKHEVVPEYEWYDVDSDNCPKIIDFNRIEPGYMLSETLRMSNMGNLIFDYQMDILPGSNEVLGPNGENLADVIDVYFSFAADPFEDMTRADILSSGKQPLVPGTSFDHDRWYYSGTLSDLSSGVLDISKGTLLSPNFALDPSNGVFGLPAGTVFLEKDTRRLVIQNGTTCTFIFHMQETAGNEYQNLSLGDVSINFMAKQAAFPDFEDDAFDSTYDQNATWPNEAPAP